MAATSFLPRPIRKGAWFPTALTVLLVLTLPGMVLLALSLFGRETAVNAWLQGHLALSYHFAGPGWPGLLLLFIPAFSAGTKGPH